MQPLVSAPQVRHEKEGSTPSLCISPRRNRPVAAGSSPNQPQEFTVVSVSSADRADSTSVWPSSVAPSWSPPPFLPAIDRLRPNPPTMGAHSARVGGLAPRRHKLSAAAAVVGYRLAAVKSAAATAAASTDAASGGPPLAALVRQPDPDGDGPPGTRVPTPSCDGPMAVAAPCPCFFGAAVVTNASGLSVDAAPALAPTRPPRATAAARDAATRALAAATPNEGHVGRGPRPTWRWVPARWHRGQCPNAATRHRFARPATVLRAAVAVTATAPLVGGGGSRPRRARPPRRRRRAVGGRGGAETAKAHRG
eukprot:TRINITY_DN13900_c0_g1_i1.p2 TRINITY_DN13900_c0_g1~~TRINITY_DN13900_c0_g1_i1.p2  ORF type:complete len:309 (+),score=42.60 TRINITY_DN13900_c0_g1_i1:453-1379(+)